MLSGSAVLSFDRQFKVSHIFHTLSGVFSFTNPHVAYDTNQEIEIAPIPERKGGKLYVTFQT